MEDKKNLFQTIMSVEKGYALDSKKRLITLQTKSRKKKIMALTKAIAPKNPKSWSLQFLCGTLGV